MTTIRLSNVTSIADSFSQDPNLSYVAKGLGAVLLSYSNDGSLDLGGIVAERPESQEEIDAAIDELRQEGYLISDGESMFFSDVKKIR